MKAVWQPYGAVPQTLGDDSNHWFITLDQLGGQGHEQVELLLQSASPYRQMLGNVSGDTVFGVLHSHATRDAAARYFASQYNAIGARGLLVLRFDSATLTMAGANLRGLIAAVRNGCEWTLRYTFGITTIT